MDIKFPYQFDTSGHTAQLSSESDHIQDMMQQILFTAPGERVNRPTFGSGIMQLVFQPNSSELATTIQFLVQGALQQWLGDLILVNSVQAVADDSLLTVTISYIVRATSQSYVATFTS